MHGYRTVVADNSGTYVGPGPVVETHGNIGFGAACNMAAALCSEESEVLVLMNPDVEISSEDLGRLVDAVASGECDLVAPATLGERGPHLGFRMPHRWRELGVTLGESGRAGGCLRALRSPRAVPPERAKAAPNRFGSAALVAVRHSLFRQVGGFDENYFLYVEDADLWDRLVAAGARAVFDGGVTLVHHAASGSVASSARRTALRRIGVELFLDDRGCGSSLVRLVHRAALPRGTSDPLIREIADGYRMGRPVDRIQRAVREIARNET